VERHIHGINCFRGKHRSHSRSRSPFIELSALAAHEVYKAEKCAFRRRRYRIGLCISMLFVANDAPSRGTYFPLTVQKHLRAQEIAMAERLPCIYLVDSGGAFLPMQTKSSPTGSFRAYLLTRRDVGTGHSANRQRWARAPAAGLMCPDVRRKRDRQGTAHFLAGPPLVKAAQARWSAPRIWVARRAYVAVRRGRSFAATKKSRLRPCVRSSPTSLEAGATQQPCLNEDRFSAQDIYGILPKDDTRAVRHTRDHSRASWTAPTSMNSRSAGTTIVCGFAAIHGQPGRHRRQ